MTTNKLKLNGEKTEIIILSNKSKKFPIDLNHLNCAGEEISIPSANVVRNLVVFFFFSIQISPWKAILKKSLNLVTFN